MKNRSKDIIISYLHTVISMAVNIIFAPILLKYIGQSEYGLYQLVASFFGYIALFETSVSTGVLRFYCKAKAKNSQYDMENILAIARKIYRFFSFILVIVGSILIFTFYHLYSKSLAVLELRESVIMLIALIGNLMITMNNAIYLAAINANEKYVFLKVLGIVSQILQPCICIIVLKKIPYALTIVVAQLLINLAVAIVRYYYAVAYLKIRVFFHNRDFYLTKRVISFAGGVLMASVADQIFWKTDQLILGRMFNTMIVAVYAIGAQLYSAYMGIGISISSVFFPRVSALYEEKDGIKKISDMFIKVGRISFCVLLLILSGFFIFGKEFICFWVGEEYLEAYYIALIIMLPYTIDIVQNIALSILQVINKYSFRAKIHFVSAVLNLLSTCALAHYFREIGAAISTGITIMITSGIIMNIYYAKIGLNIRGFWKEIFIILAKMLPFISISYLLNKKILLSDGVVGLVFKIIIYAMLYLVLILVGGLKRKEKENLLVQIKKKY